MEFNVNSPILFVLAGILVAFVLAQSVFFLVKAWKRGVKIGMDKSKLKRVARTAAIFTIAPAIAIVISVITLSQKLGLPLPWLRLSVIGSLSYETVAASNALTGMGLSFETMTGLTAVQYATIVVVMTVSILVGIWLAPLVAERYQKGLTKFEKRDKKWFDILSASMFIGMISAFIGYVFCDVGKVTEGTLSGFVPVGVFLVSALVMVLSGVLLKKFKWRWISDYALPISLVVGMASAIPLSAWLK